MVTAPVLVQSDVGHTCYTHQFFWCYVAEELAPHWGEVNQMTALSQILLSNLQLSHLFGVFDVIEDRSVWFAWLEIQRTILRLQYDVVSELAIQWCKLAYSLLNTILTLVCSAIYKAAPHYDTTIRLNSIGQHIGTISMRALIVERTWLSLAVGLYQKSSKVRYLLIYLLGLSLPPCLNLWVQRVGSLQHLSLVETLGWD